MVWIRSHVDGKDFNIHFWTIFIHQTTFQVSPIQASDDIAVGIAYADGTSELPVTVHEAYSNIYFVGNSNRTGWRLGLPESSRN